MPAHAQQYFAKFVEPTVDDFLRDPSDERLATLACLMLQSMADHYFHSTPQPADGQRTPEDFRIAMGRSNFAYRTVMDIANATKHFVRKKYGLDFSAIQSNDIHCGNLRCGWPINGQYVMVETGTDAEWLVSQLVEVSMEMWRSKLNLAPPPRQMWKQPTS